MRTINRALATGFLVLPLTFGAAGMAAADTDPVNPGNDRVGVSEQEEQTEHDNGGVLNFDGLFGDLLGDDSEQDNRDGQHDERHGDSPDDRPGFVDKDAPGNYNGKGDENGKFVPF